MNYTSRMRRSWEMEKSFFCGNLNDFKKQLGDVQYLD